MLPDKLPHILQAAFQSLLQRKVRSALSVLGVVCGVTAVVAMIAIGQGARQAAVRDIEQLGTRNVFIRAVDLTEAQIAQSREQLSYGLLDADVQRLVNGCDLIADAAGLRRIRASVMGLPSEVTLQVVACSPLYFHLLNLPLFAGRFLAPMDEERRNLVCILGSEAARRMGDAGSVGRYIRIENHLFKVVGILKPIEYNRKPSAISTRNSNEMIFLPLASTHGLFASQADDPVKSRIHPPLTEIIVQVDRIEEVTSAARQIERIMQVAHHDTRDFQVVIPLELLHQAERTNRMFNLVLGAIAGISLIVGGIGIMNIMLANVSERTREIGIRRAVGASRRHILVQFLSEAMLLTLCGGTIGLLCGLAATGLIALMAGWPMAVTFWGLALPLVMALLVGLFFGIHPARKAAMVDPIVALRHTG